MSIPAALISVFGILLVTYYLGVIRGAPWVPTTTDTVERMIESARIKPGDKVADLGSGDGRLVIAAARAGAIAHGFEINPLLVWISRWKIKKAGLGDRAFIHTKNFWFQDFSEFDVVMLFGITGIMKGLEEKFQKELKPGSRIISNTFRFPDWVAEKNMNVFAYRIEKKS